MAHAQNFGGIEQAPQYSRGNNVSVKERQHPEWAPIDINLGGFTLAPQIALSSLFNDNERYTATGAQSDVSWRIQPGVSLGSNWARNGFGLQAFLAQTEYTRFTEDDTTEYGVNLSGRLDLADDLTIDLKGDDQHLALPRSDPDIPVDSDGLPMFDRQDFQTTVTKTLPRFQLQGIVAVRNETYGSTGSLDNNGPYDFSERNGTYLSYSGRISYGLSPAVAAFVGALYDQSFRPTFDKVSQNAQGVNAAAGVNFDLTRLARGEIAVGYIYQSYDTPNTQADSGVAFNANLQYFPTQLTTVSLVAERSSAPASVAGSAGGISTSASVNVDHELLRNVILSAGASVGQVRYANYLLSRNNYQNRTDTSYGGTFGASYLMNRLVTWEFGYAFADYKSTDALRRSYTDNKLSLTLRLTR